MTLEERIAKINSRYNYQGSAVEDKKRSNRFKRRCYKSCWSRS